MDVWPDCMDLILLHVNKYISFSFAFKNALHATNPTPSIVPFHSCTFGLLLLFNGFFIIKNTLHLNLRFYVNFFSQEKIGIKKNEKTAAAVCDSQLKVQKQVV